MSYKVIYHVGNEISIETRANGATLSLQEQSILISNSSAFEVPYSSLVSVGMFRLHGLGRMIKVVCDTQTIFISVVRLNLAGYFAIINFLKTGELYEEIKVHIPH